MTIQQGLQHGWWSTAQLSKCSCLQLSANGLVFRTEQGTPYSRRWQTSLKVASSIYPELCKSHRLGEKLLGQQLWPL